LVIFEIQQNSDTTYRVSDWNRLGLDGKPREVHVAQSLASIDFGDFEPDLVRGQSRAEGATKVWSLVRDPLFTVEVWLSSAAASWSLAPGRMRLIGVVAGRLQVVSSRGALALLPGQFCLLPAALSAIELRAESGTSCLQAEAGTG